MAKKIFKLIMLSTLFFALGSTVASCANDSNNDSNVDEEPKDEEDKGQEQDEIEISTDFYDHTHDGWISLSQSDFTSGSYTSGNLPGGNNEDEMKYYYLDEDVTLSTNDITTSEYVTLCLNSYTLMGTGSDTPVITISDNSYFNLCECNSDNMGAILNGSPGVHVSSSATFDMYGGRISENSSNELQKGAGVNVYNATFNMYGGTIEDNTSSYHGGGVYVLESSKFTMFGGTITDNSTERGGSGVIVYSNSTFDMYGGTISDNYSSSYGAGVYVYDSTFYMYDGTIQGNSGYYGGGVYLSYGSGESFYMYGGTISDNYSSSDGAGVHVNYQCTFYMYGGTISDNNTSARGAGVYIAGQPSSFYMYGGTLTNNDSSYGIYSLYAPTVYIYDGYINDGISLGYSATCSITGGYFSVDAYSSARNYIVSGWIRVDLSLLGSDLDDNYVEGFPYAIYTEYSSLSDETISLDVTYGTLYELEITDEYTSLEYTIDINGATTIFENYPTYLGTYSITAHLLFESTIDEITTKYYGTRTISINISKAQAEITINSIGKEYDGEEASIDYIATVGDLDITDASVVTWYDENGEEINAPSEIGTYKATVSIDDTSVYDGTAVNINYSITGNEGS